MNKTNGRYIVLEGPQGSGKTVQIEMLAHRLEAAGYAVRLFREPDSQSDLTARAIRAMTQDPTFPMNTRTEVLLYNAARSQSLEVIRRARDNGIICLCDRNYLTTLAVQYYGRGDIPDYEAINNIINFAVSDMQPDLTIILDAPCQILRERSVKRDGGERFDNLDEGFLERVRAGYLWEAKQRDYPVVYAADTPEKVHEDIWNILSGPMRPMLKPTDSKPKMAAQEAVSVKEVLQSRVDAPQLDENAPLLKKRKDGTYEVTSAGKDWLDKTVTSTDGDVYGFSDSINQTTIAAAMARLSRRGDDMRITLLDEFANNAGKDDKLLQRVITAYGDDSVQQLIGTYIVVENASNLLTKKLEWGRLAAYLEQSTRYIYFDQKDAKGKYRYFTPKDLPKSLKVTYNSTLDQIFDLYSEMVRELTNYVRDHSEVPEAERDVAFNGATRAQACDAVRSVLPVATKSTVGIYASGQALESLIMHLQSDELPEARDVGQSMLKEARKTIPTFLERADKPDRGGALVAYRANTHKSMQAFANENLPQNLGDLDNDVQLVEYWPRNELDLLPHMLYEHSNMSLKAIEQAVESWSYEQKLKAFKTYMGERLNRRHKPGRSLEVVHYSWDLLCDYGIFRDLQRHRMVDAFEWQELTPRYGFDTPELVEKAGLTDKFERCFDLSAELYSKLQEAGFMLEAQYATLLGHRMRWKITYNAREAFHFHELRTSPQGHPGYRKLVRQMHEKVAEVHPLLAESMKFVNQGENPELTRLAAERYTQFKLEQLG